MNRPITELSKIYCPPNGRLYSYRDKFHIIEEINGGPMYIRHTTMIAYNAAERAWPHIKRFLIVILCLYGAYILFSQIYVGIIRNAEYRGEQRMKRENFETFKRMEAQKGIKKP